LVRVRVVCFGFLIIAFSKLMVDVDSRFINGIFKRGIPTCAAFSLPTIFLLHMSYKYKICFLSLFCRFIFPPDVNVPFTMPFNPQRARPCVWCVWGTPSSIPIISRKLDDGPWSSFFFVRRVLQSFRMGLGGPSPTFFMFSQPQGGTKK